MKTPGTTVENQPTITGNRFYDRIKSGVQHPPFDFWSKTPKEWRKWWLQRYSCTLKSEPGLTYREQKQFLDTVTDYLSRHPFNPRAISVEKLYSFIKADPARLSPPVLLFYQRTAESPDHIAALQNAIQTLSKPAIALPTPQPPAQPESPKEIHCTATPFSSLLASLRTELAIRNYSRRTIKNYLRIVTDFLSWHAGAPTAEDAPRIIQYNLFLREQSGFAPRTVNLYSAAISFFYRKVIKTTNITELVPRMKIGKPLPKVYSEQQVELLISVTKNPKHRLVLMLAYGGGLRLEEIRLLRRTSIDFDKEYIRIVKGKGRKDRIIMLDEGIKKALKAYIAEKPEIDYLFINDTTGKLLSSRTIEKIFDHACRKSGVPKVAGIHTLRHRLSHPCLEACGVQCCAL